VRDLHGASRDQWRWLFIKSASYVRGQERGVHTAVAAAQRTAVHGRQQQGQKQRLQRGEKSSRSRAVALDLSLRYKHVCGVSDRHDDDAGNVDEQLLQKSAAA
jgi:hypothetical protein